MGNQDALQHDTRDKKRTRKEKKQKKEFGFVETSSLSPAYWADCHPSNTIEMIDAITAAGGAVMLTRSQDGGTLGIRVYHDDYTLKTYWARPGDELDDLVSNITGEIAT